MKTFLEIIRNAPALISLLSMILAALPRAVALIGKIREAFDSEKVKEAIQAFNEFIGGIAPPAPTADSTGTIPANPKQEKRRRFRRFMNRIRIAMCMSDTDEQNLCAKYNIQPYTEGKT